MAYSTPITASSSSNSASSGGKGKGRATFIDNVASSASGLLSTLTTPSPSITQSLASSQASSSKASSSNYAQPINHSSSSASVWQTTSSQEHKPTTTSSMREPSSTFYNPQQTIQSTPTSDFESFANLDTLPLWSNTEYATSDSPPSLQLIGDQTFWDWNYTESLDGSDVVGLLANNTMTSLGLMDEYDASLQELNSAWNSSQEDDVDLDGLFVEEDVTYDPVEWLNLTGEMGEYTEYVWGDKLMGKRRDGEVAEKLEDACQDLSQVKASDKIGHAFMKSRL